MMAAGCIGEPISWLRLEQFALDREDVKVSEHVASCAACRQCLDEIRDDVVALPVLVVPDRGIRRASRWWIWAVPALAVAAIAVLLLRPRATADNVTTVKGVGDVVLELVRERGGAIREHARTFAPGDRWKVVVTCPPDKGAWIDVGVIERGAAAADYPIAPAHVTCGNRVVVPGAFVLTGGQPNRVCVRIAVDGAPARSMPRAGEPDVACVTIVPE